MCVTLPNYLRVLSYCTLSGRMRAFWTARCFVKWVNTEQTEAVAALPLAAAHAVSTEH